MSATETTPTPRPIPKRRLVMGGAFILVLLIGATIAGTVPRIATQHALARVAAVDTIPTVNVVSVARAGAASSLTLPGTLQPVHQAAIYARATGYVKKFFVDLGSTVHAGQVLGIIETPDLDQQLAQARAVLHQDETMLALNRTEDQRWQQMVRDSVVTVEQYDQKRQAYQGSQAAVLGDQANVDRLAALVGFERIVAPFDGVITSRNIDVGAFVTATGGQSATLPSGSSVAPSSLFGITQTDTMRVYLSVPETDAPSVRPGETAQILVSELPNDTFTGRVVRTARAVDPASRTLLTEVQIVNTTGKLVPGMYARATLGFDRQTPPLTVPASAVLFLPAGLTVAEIDSNHVVRRHVIDVGRDFGSYFEVLSGVRDGSLLLDNPSDAVPNGTRVQWQVHADTTRAQPVAVR
ncbi:MAG TPA: efflux RND transporter periplasmic adaptor subunit [Gemmatimonadaceae bacterium]|nr:efflux RND transporter periplasmic adaptor subunit [Gemmatimonadaceae bacterium]